MYPEKLKVIAQQVQLQQQQEQVRLLHQEKLEREQQIRTQVSVLVLSQPILDMAHPWELPSSLPSLKQQNTGVRVALWCAWHLPWAGWVDSDVPAELSPLGVEKG